MDDHNIPHLDNKLLPTYNKYAEVGILADMPEIPVNKIPKVFCRICKQEIQIPPPPPETDLLPGFLDKGGFMAIANFIGSHFQIAHLEEAKVMLRTQQNVFGAIMMVTSARMLDFSPNRDKLTQGAINKFDAALKQLETFCAEAKHIIAPWIEEKEQE